MKMHPDAVAETRHPPCRIVEVSDGLCFVAASPAMLRVRAQVEQVARIEAPVLCLGESGTGKEVVARLLHKLSLRSQRPFLKVNCAALPRELLESELFGYETEDLAGAVRAKPGKLALCNQGTILLDEIAEMPPVLQAKLVQALQDQEPTLPGSCSRARVAVRLLATSSVDLGAAIEAKRLREDLCCRLSTVVFHLPPLRERREDIPVLLDFYLGHFAQRYGVPRRVLSNRMLEACLNHDWPGNVRELESFAKRYLILGDHTNAWYEAAPNHHPEGGETGPSGRGPNSAVRTMNHHGRRGG